MPPVVRTHVNEDVGQEGNVRHRHTFTASVSTAPVYSDDSRDTDYSYSRFSPTEKLLVHIAISIIVSYILVSITTFFNRRNGND